MKKVEFNIEKSTMRELSQIETNEVAGGTSPILTITSTSNFTVTTPQITLTTTGNDDGIFDGDFEEQN